LTKLQLCALSIATSFDTLIGWVEGQDRQKVRRLKMARKEVCGKEKKIRA